MQPFHCCSLVLLSFPSHSHMFGPSVTATKPFNSHAPRTCERKACRSAPEMASVQPACAPGGASREVRRPGVLAPDWDALPMPRCARYAAIRLV